MILYQGDTRRGFVFGPISDPALFSEAKSDGVKLIGNMLRFSKELFSDPYSCETWIAKVSGGASDVMHVKRMATETKSIEISEDDWSEMTKLMPSPETVDRNFFRVYKSYLANNAIDRDSERFTIGLLRSFARTLPGKSKIFNHDWYNDAGAGRYFSASLEKVSLDRMLELCGETTYKDFKSLLEIAEERDGGLFWLVGKYYVTTLDPELIFKIDSGIYSFESIGFRAPKLAPVVDKSGKVLFNEWVEGDSGRTGEATEGSFVFLGSQYGARTGKSALESAIDVTTLRAVEDIIDDKFPEQNDKPKEERKSMKFKMKLFGEERELDSEDANALQEFETEMGSKIAALEDEKSKSVNRIDNLVKIVTAIGLNETATEEMAKKVAEDAEAFRKSAIEDAMRYGGLAGIVESDSEKASAHRSMLEKLSTSEVVTLGESYKSAYEKRNPPEAQIQNTPEEQEGEKPESEKSAKSDGASPRGKLFRVI